MDGHRDAPAMKRPNRTKALDAYVEPSKKVFNSASTDTMVKRIYDEIKIDASVSS